MKVPMNTVRKTFHCAAAPGRASLSTSVLARALTLASALAAGLAALLVLPGCASVLTPLGSNSYDCNRKENPASPYCHSFKSVESSTNGAIPSSRYDQTMRMSDLDQMTGIAPVTAPIAGPASAQSSGPNGATPAHAVPPLARSATLEGLPVREGPVVQRVWVKRFVDGNDLLVGDTVIYKEIIPSHWQGFARVDVASDAANVRATRSFPHKPPPAAAPKSADGAAAHANQNLNAPASAYNSFSQPGAQAPQPSGMVTVPATPSGTTSMPQ